MDENKAAGISLVVVSLVLSVVAILGVVGVVLFYGSNLFSFNQAKNPNQITSSKNIPLGNKSNFPVIDNKSNEFFYTNNNNLYVFDGTSSKRLTTNGEVGVFRLRPGTTQVGYIKQKAVYPEMGGSPYIAGYAISLLDLKTGVTTEILPRKYSDQELAANTGRVTINDFDFSPDGKKMVYARDGVYVTNLEGDNGQDQQLTSNYWPEEQRMIDVKTYITTDWSPDGRNILLRAGKWEWVDAEIYNVDSKNITPIEGVNAESWNDKGDMILGYSTGGMGDGGIWIYSLSTSQTRRYLGKDYSSFAIPTATFLPDNRIVAAIGSPFEPVDPNYPLEEKNTALYFINSPEKVQLIKVLPKTIPGSWAVVSDLESTKDGKYLYYFELVSQKEADIKRLNLATKDVETVVTGVSTPNALQLAQLELANN